MTEIKNLRFHVRQMRLDEVRLMIRYFLDADHEFLNGMGVDPGKLPSESVWLELLEEDFARPIRKKQFDYLVWEIDGTPVGHCNINQISFGQLAYMHLHIWNAHNRRCGCASQLLKPSIIQFFERFELHELYCEPYALNPPPNKTLPKNGFRLVKTYDTTPGWITFHQPVNLWVLDRKTAMDTRETP